jgi:DNA-binding NtrC family response regulator
VDDETELLCMIKDSLSTTPCELLLSTSTEEALDVLRKSDRVVLIIADLRLPGQDGLALLEQAREIAPSAGRILMTAYPHGARAIEAVERGTAQRFVTKPWEAARLRRTVENYVAGYQAAGQSA